MINTSITADKGRVQICFLFSNVDNLRMSPVDICDISDVENQMALNDTSNQAESPEVSVGTVKENLIRTGAGNRPDSVHGRCTRNNKWWIGVVGVVGLLVVAVVVGIIAPWDKHVATTTAPVATTLDPYQGQMFGRTRISNSSNLSPKHTTEGKTSTIRRDGQNTTRTTPSQRVCETNVTRIDKYDPNDDFICDDIVQQVILNSTCLLINESCNTCEEVLHGDLNLHRNPNERCCTRKTFCDMGKYCGEGRLGCKIGNPNPQCFNCRPGFHGNKCQLPLSLATVQCQCYHSGVVKASKELCTNTYIGGEEKECRLGNCSCDLSKEIKPGSYEMCEPPE